MALGEIDKYIIQKVKERRMELGYSQAHLSFLLGKAEGYISNYESHKRGKFYSAKIINELAKALDCSPKDFWPNDPL
jgi:transcriptional regulator with XRE-family HTH domain